MTAAPKVLGWIAWFPGIRMYFSPEHQLGAQTERLDEAAVFATAAKAVRAAERRSAHLCDPLRLWADGSGKRTLALPTWTPRPFTSEVPDEGALEQMARAIERRAEGAMALAPVRMVTNLQRIHLWGKAEGLRLAARELRTYLARVGT